MPALFRMEKHTTWVMCIPYQLFLRALHINLQNYSRPEMKGWEGKNPEIQCLVQCVVALCWLPHEATKFPDETKKVKETSKPSEVAMREHEGVLLII